MPPKRKNTTATAKKKKLTAAEETAEFKTLFADIRSRLVTGSWPVPTLCSHLEPHLTTIVNLVSRCIFDGESNSILVCGPAGCGKSTLVDRALASFKHSNPDVHNYKTIHLEGKLLPDIKACLRAISIEMCSQPETHQSSEHSEDEDEEEDPIQTALSVSNSLRLLMSSLGATRAGDMGTGLVFVLKSFEQFAGSKNQMLLYNLFDTCQSFKTPLLVIALSRRLDVVELLEKRVKSRFSHRQVSLYNDLSYSQYINCAKELLSSNTANTPNKLIASWDNSVQDLFSNSQVEDFLERVYNVDGSVVSLKHLLAKLHIQCMRDSRDWPQLSPEHLVTIVSEYLGRDTMSYVLASLSQFELVLLAAMKNLTARTEGEPFNFEQVYQEYVWFARHSGSGVRPVDKHTSLNIFLTLPDLGLTLPVTRGGGGRGSVQANYRMYSLLLDHTQALEAVHSSQYCPASVKMWASGTLTA